MRCSRIGRALLALAATAIVAAPAYAQDAQDTAARKGVVLHTLKDIHLAMAICWQASLPPPSRATPGMRVTMRVSFTRSGEILGEPLFTFVTPGVRPDTRALYERAAAAALNRCTPLPFSDGLGNAVAGQPRVFLFIDRRNEKKV
jgi:hypothetical protein